uniref:Uncharacterized protein n=1 Tax=Arundo donax TaxID=35708 RepID=A0A0A9AM95_ARUDO
MPTELTPTVVSWRKYVKPILSWLLVSYISLNIIC